MGAAASAGVARRNKGEEKQIARERVVRLVELAEEALRMGLVLRAGRYGEIAWRVKTTFQLRGSPVDGRLCRACHSFLGPGTARVRFATGKRTVTCLRCGEVRRRPLRPRARAPDVQRT